MTQWDVWNTSNVRNMKDMFRNATSFNFGNYLNLNVGYGKCYQYG